jgi:o-succinylbenzoate synthase
VEDDIALVREVKNALPSGVSLRLDANRAWSPEQALTFGKAVADCVIEYIEEPLADNSLLERFHTETGLPLALDETLDDTTPKSFHPIKGVTALILKPAALGGFEKTMQFAGMAQRHNLKPVISGVFQSGLGLTADACLAAGLNEDDVPAGLGTFKWLKEDVLVNKFRAQNGQVNVLEAFEKSRAIRYNLLIPV